MVKFNQLPSAVYRMIKHPPKIAYALGLGPLIGRWILLLTTTGRKTGKPRATPLQYEIIGDKFHIGSARGVRSDWVKNILSNPQVKIRVKSCQFNGIAEVKRCPSEIADYLEFRLSKHPRLVGAILKTDGLPSKPNRKQLEAYAQQIVLVTVRPLENMVLHK
jgi:deazaflavin-dependent oxidoreductase (nitroreductase family)